MCRPACDVLMVFVRYGNRNFLPSSLSYPGLPLLVFCKLNIWSAWSFFFILQNPRGGNCLLLPVTDYAHATLSLSYFLIFLTISGTRTKKPEKWERVRWESASDNCPLSRPKTAPKVARMGIFWLNHQRCKTPMSRIPKIALVGNSRWWRLP